MEHNLIIDILGWIGTVVYLSAYVLVSNKKVMGNSKIYQTLNFFGGVLLLINSAFYRAFPSVGVNAVWIGIALVTLVRNRNSTSG